MPVEDPEPLIGAVKFFVRLDLDQICLFLDGHQLAKKPAGGLKLSKKLPRCKSMETKVQGFFKLYLTQILPFVDTQEETRE